MILVLLAVLTALATFCGGLFALRFKDKSHLIIGFSAGAVIGVAFFDLLPEAIETTSGYITIGHVVPVIALGFLLYMIIDRIWGVHAHGHDDHNEELKHRGVLRAGSLSFHSFLDGLGIGFAFQVSATLGAIVAVAVLAHDFSDGINTVSAIIKGGGTYNRALKWLSVDAFAPAVGIIATLFFSLPQHILGLALALFAGFFLYIGASDLVPESYHGHPTWKTTLATVLGAAFLFVVISIAS